MFGQEALGVCFVCPITLALDAPAIGIATTITSAAHSAANATA